MSANNGQLKSIVADNFLLINNDPSRELIYDLQWQTCDHH